MLTAKDLHGLYAILPTPSLLGSDKLDALNTVDLDETERVVNALLADGSKGLIALGTTGECATLSNADYDAFVACLLEVVNKRVPVFVGASALGGHEVVRRIKFLGERGAEGSLLGLPQWQPATDEIAINFYTEISRLFPEIGIMVYANERAFRYSFPDLFWEAMAKRAPSVMAAKYSRPKDLKGLLALVGDRIHIMPNEMTLAGFHQDAPETTTACWATAASMGPQPAVALMDAVLRRDEAEISRLSASLAWANEPVTPIIRNRELFAQYNIQVEKARIDAAGYCKAGPVRPPYAVLPKELLEPSQECGRRWAALCANSAQNFAIPSNFS